MVHWPGSLDKRDYCVIFFQRKTGECRFLLLFYILKINENNERKMKDGHWALQSKLLEKIEQNLVENEYFVKYLEELSDMLNVECKTIKGHDNNILSLINAKNVEYEKMNIEEYNHKIISCKNELNFKIICLNSYESITYSNNIDSVRTCHAPSRI